jgi:hypothetical protein
MSVPKSPTSSGWMVGTWPSITSPVEPSMVMTSSSRTSTPPTFIRRALVIDLECPAPDTQGRPCHGRPRRRGWSCRPRRQDALRGVHAANVFRRGLGPDQDHLFA